MSLQLLLMEERLFDLIPYQMANYPQDDCLGAKVEGEWRKYSTKECQEIVEVLAQNGLEDRSLEVLIAMDGDVAEPDHSFHGIGGLEGDASGLLEEIK